MSQSNTIPEDKSIEIPHVPMQYMGLLGNLPDMDPGFQAKSFWQMADLYGPIYKLKLVDRNVVVISNYELMKDVMDDDRFDKLVSGSLAEIRNLLGDGLFTAQTNEFNWEKAHRILVPVFGPIAIRKMFNEQLDIASQMILKWDRLGPSNTIMCSDDFTRLAFDTIGLCAFNFRFNEFYSEDLHPFAVQMGGALAESARRSNRTHLENKLRYLSSEKYWSDIKAMHALCDEIIEDRIKNPQPEVNDLLNVMLSAEDPVSHEKLGKENIRYQMATFLVAGHETTSGTLSFLMYHLLHNPETYHKAQKEVDEVLGNDQITVEHLPNLKYLDACLKETLRFMGPITHIGRHAREPTKIAGKYPIDEKAMIICNMRGIHHDATVWGEDVGVFRPERIFELDNLPLGAFCPFGVGYRACIGRTFAEQEMIINVALILQRFQVELVDPSYTLGIDTIKSAGTIKPDGFKIRVRRRPGKSASVGLSGHGTEGKHETHRHVSETPLTKQSLTILYGSNAGTCKAYAEDLAASASDFKVTIQTMDSATEHVPTDQPVIIITPSYEGKPADNAKKFVSWLETNASSPNLLKGVKYSVFGVGNSEWTSTYHKVPKLVDEYFDKLGATRISDTGFVDVKTDPAGPWEHYLETLWPAIGGNSDPNQYDLKATITVSDASVTLGGPELSSGIVRENIDLADDSVGPSKKHIEIELPEDVSYKTGDYLAILPFNSRDIVRRVLKRFGLRPDDKIMIENTNKGFLRTSTPVSVFELLSSRVELNTPITQKQLSKLASLTKDSKEKSSIEFLARRDVYGQDVLPKRFSVLDILEDYPSCELDFAAFLDMLKAMSLRQYSISSSPLAPKNLGSSALTASLSYDVHTGGELAHPERLFNGIASSYLAACLPGTRIHCAVKSTNAAFHLPKDPSIPIIMIAAGTGIAPMRGFIEERAAIAAARGKPVGPALLYFGCRDFEKDYIYKEELEHWQELGAVVLRPSFSKRAPPDANQAWKYVPDRMWDEREEIATLFSQGAKIFVCGSASKLAKSTAEVCKKIYKERTGASDSEADAWLEKVREDRYVSDVFG